MDAAADALKILGLTYGASWDEVNQAYRDLVRVWHPDRFQGDRLRERAEEQTRRLNSAVRTLRSHYKEVPPPLKTFSSVAPKSTSRRAPVPATRPTPSAETNTAQAYFFGNRQTRSTARDDWDARPSYRSARVEVAPLAVYPRRLKAAFKVIVAALITAVGFQVIERWGDDPHELAAGCLASLASLHMGMKNLCFLLIRRPVLQVDRHGLNSFSTGRIDFDHLSRVWSFSQASVPALAVECNEKFLNSIVWWRRFFLRLRHLIGRTHYVLHCGGLDRHPEDVVRALEAQQLIGDVFPINKAPTARNLRLDLLWCRIVSVAVAVSCVGRGLLHFELRPTELAIYFGLFAIAQAYATAVKLLRPGV
jgi:DnaJ domain